MYKNNENMLAKGNVDRQQLQSEIGTYAGLVNGVPNPLKQDPDPVVANIEKAAAWVIDTLSKEGMNINDVAGVIKEMRNQIAERLVNDIQHHKGQIERSEMELHIIREA